MDPRLLLSKHTIDTETTAGMKSLTTLLGLQQRLNETRTFQSLDSEMKEELSVLFRELEHHSDIVLDSLYRIKKVPKNWM